MDRAPRLREADVPARHERDRAEQRHAGAIELEKRQPPEDHPEVDDGEDDDDGGGHAPAW